MPLQQLGGADDSILRPDASAEVGRTTTYDLIGDHEADALIGGRQRV